MTDIEQKKRVSKITSLLVRSELTTKNLVAILEVLNKELQDSVSRFQTI